MITTYKEQICNVLNECLNKDRRLVIYPFGARGQQVKEILNTEYKVKENYIVDNCYDGDSQVINCQKLRNSFSDDMLILLCCDNLNVKAELYQTLEGISKRNIVDVFPKDNIYIFDWSQKSIEPSMVCELEAIYFELQKTAFEGTSNIHALLEKYDRRALSECFEAYILQNVKNKSLQRAYSLLLYALTKELKIDKKEKLAGNAVYRDVNSTYPVNVYQEIYQLQRTGEIDGGEAEAIREAWEMRLFTRFPGGHVVPGYDRILKIGIGQCMQEIKKRLAETEVGNEAKKRFYQSEIVALRALQELIKRYANLAKDLFLCDEENGRIVKNCESIIYEKPCSFEQAVQLLWLAHEMMISEGNIKGISMGRMDQYLYPFYERDIQAGILDQEKAFDLICSFWRKLEFDRRALAFQNVTLGGLTVDGKDGSNQLTILFLQAQLQIKSNQPMLSLRTNKLTSSAVWERSIDLLSTGRGVPALFNDDIVIRAKQEAGICWQDAVNYSIIGCVEPTVGGKEYSHTEGLRLNVAKILELIFFRGVCPVTGVKYLLYHKRELDSFFDFEDLYSYFKRALSDLIQKACDLLCKADKSYGEKWPVPYLSLYMEECLINGKDVTNGGTKYNNLSINFAGMANVVNSLIAVKEIVYEMKLIALSEIPEILKNNFKGYEHIEKEILRLPKYGNNCEETDSLMKELIGFIIAEVNQQSALQKRIFQVGFYTVTLHAEMGKYMVATFDGRKKGAALASSLSPAQGTDVRGPLAVFHSVTKTAMNRMSNGMVLDLRFMPTFFEKARSEKIKNSILTYFALGGMEVQLNVIDQETLLEAQRNPKEYMDLIVRVSGFSTYFVELEKVLQDEIILRYAHKSL